MNSLNGKKILPFNNNGNDIDLINSENNSVDYKNKSNAQKQIVDENVKNNLRKIKEN